MLASILVIGISPAEAARARGHRHRRYVVALDAGHGGRDPGATRRGARLPEKRVTLDVALRLAHYLRRRGVKVRLSRMGDRTLRPPVRAKWLDRTHSDVLVSLHCDAAPGRIHAAGATTYFHSGSRASKKLARSIQTRLVRVTSTRNRGAQPDRVRCRHGFYMLRRAHRPAALVELGYISHPATARKMSRPAYRQRLAQGVGAGLLHYLR